VRNAGSREWMSRRTVSMKAEGINTSKTNPPKERVTGTERERERERGRVSDTTIVRFGVAG